MPVPPDPYMMMIHFIWLFPAEYREHLFKQLSFSAKVNMVEEFVQAAKNYETSLKTVQYFDLHSMGKRDEQTTKAAPQAAKQPPNPPQRNYPSSSQPRPSWQAKATPSAMAKRPGWVDDRKDRPRPLGFRAKPVDGKGKASADKALCFNCNKPGHWARNCPLPKHR